MFILAYNFEQTIYLTYFLLIAIFLIFTIFIIGFVYLSKNKQSVLFQENLLKQSQLEKQQLEAQLDKFQALQSERDRISIDMHDDLGSGLSSIKLISEMLKKKHNDPDSQEDLNQIVEHATELTSTMREMVWSLNPRNDTLERFLHFIQQYSRQFFEPSDIKIAINIPSSVDEIEMSGYVRRNVFLCYKEILNNCIKHSKATQIDINCNIEQRMLSISVQDNGIGLSENYKPNNGFYSMEKRIQDCDGKFKWSNHNPGLKIFIQIPLTTQSSTNV